MVTFAPLTPELLKRLAQSRCRSFLRRVGRSPDRLERAIEAALEAGPNAKAISRAARRLGRHPSVAGATVLSEGSAYNLVFFDRRVAETDFSRFDAGATELRTFESMALVYRGSRITWRKRRRPIRLTMGHLYFERHSIARFLERGPLDPRTATDGDLRAAFDVISREVMRANFVVDAAFCEQRLDRALASRSRCHARSAAACG